MSNFGDRFNGHRLSFALVAVISTLLTLAASASAATYTVNSPTDAALSNASSSTCPSTCSLREAVQAADNNGGVNTINVPAGTDTLTIGNPNQAEGDNPAVGDLDINNGVTLTIAGAGASSTIINADDIDRAFAVHSGGSLSISGVTIENGSQTGENTTGDYQSESTEPDNGGAIYNDGALIVNNSVLRDDSASSQGGAVYADTAASSTSITNSTVDGNSTANGDGGVVLADAGSVTFTNDTITNNSSGSEGGVLCESCSGPPAGPVSISASTISDNVSRGGGGALYVSDSSTSITISDSTFDSDTTGNPGGVLFDGGEGSGTITITGSTMSDDSSGNAPGGVVYVEDASAMSVGSSTFDDDTGGDGGGALYVEGTNLSVTGSTFNGDQGSQGGAVYLSDSVSNPTTSPTQTITSSTFFDDEAPNGSGGAIDDSSANLDIARTTFADDSSVDGGAVLDGNGDALALTNDTFDGNESVDGGALDLNDTASAGAPIALLNDTIAHNTAYEGGGIFQPEDANQIENTIVADNTGGSTPDGGGDCYGTKATDNAGSSTDLGGNIDSDGTCFSGSTNRDHTDVNPDLGALASNGSPLETDALLAGSPAIGDAIPGSCPSFDERGVPRPSACDSGAFQTATASLAISAGGTPATTVFAPITDTFTVTNNGPSAATAVTFTDTLPPGTQFFGSSSSQGSCSGTATVTCSLGTIDSSDTSSSATAGSATVTIVLIPTVSGSVTNSATVATADGSSASTGQRTTVTPASAPAHGAAPVVLTGVASAVTKSGAKLSALINPAGQFTTYTFEVGTSARNETARAHGSVNGSGAKAVLVKVKGLKAGKTYHFRIVAKNAAGTTTGQSETFRTK